MKKVLLILSVILFSHNLKSQNEDFEDADLTNTTPSTLIVVSPLGINGWTVSGGSNSSWGATGNCTNTTALTGAPNACAIIGTGVFGHVDPIIGPAYKIYSVYGSSLTTYFNATTLNGFQCYGNWFLKLNNQTPGASVNRISKTIMVTPANALFQFATMSVIEGSHCCCDNPGFTLRLKVNSGCSSVSTLTTCPSFSASPPAGSGCTPTGTCSSPGNATTYSVSTINPAWSYSKWKKSTIDLSSFIGSCVTVELTAFDCPYSAHAGYTFFDAQSSPLEVIVNGNSYAAGIPMINVGTCGAGPTATITAPLAEGGYTWTTPGAYTVAAGSGGQTIYTSTTGNHTVVMNPPGACSPIIRVINLAITPAPNMAVISTTQTSCVNPFLNGTSIMMSSGTPNGTLTPNYYVNFSPAQPSNTIGVSANSGTYTGLAPGINTITVTDAMGCKTSQTININGMPVFSSLSINAPSGTVLGCNPPIVPLNAVNTSTDPLAANMTFTWTGPSTFSVSPNINAFIPGSYTVMGQATYTTSSGSALSCISASVITISGSTLVPTCNVAPATRTLACGGSCQSFTAATSSGTTNVIGSWYAPGPSTIKGPTVSPMVLCVNAPGTYTAEFCSTISGCCSTQTVAVFSSTIIPTITVTPTSFNGFTINCSNPKVIMNTNTSSLTGPFGYTWTPLPSPPGFPVPSTIGNYTATMPGQYEIKFIDGNMCPVSSTVTVYIDTLRPSPTAITNLSSSGFTLNCFNSCLTASAITSPMLPTSSYSWTTPGPLTFASHSISVCLANITSSTAPTVYTVSAMGANGCIGKQKINFYKDIAVPLYNAVFTPSTITCSNPCVAMSPSSTSTVPVTFTFTSPPPTQTATTAGALMCVPGTYTMTYMNINNGCLGTATANVNVNTFPPSIIAQPTVYLLCGATTTVISAGATSTTYSYTWDGPSGAGISCMSGTACSTPSINMPGVYNVNIINTSNGCSTTNSVLVLQASTLPISITGNTMICVGEIAVLSGSGASSYTWSTGSNANSIGVSPTVTTTYTLTGEVTGSITCSGQTTITIIVDPCIGIKELEWSKNISIAPNPNTGKFSVNISANIENGELKIINSIGQEVLKQNVKQGKNEINASGLAKGIYHYVILQNKEPVNKGKIVID